MERKRVEGSNLREIGHEQGVGLEVQFHAKGCPARSGAACACDGGDVWRYPNVTAGEYVALVSAPSKGAHFHAFIRNRHVGEQL